MAEPDPKTTFNLSEAVAQLSVLVDRAHEGEEIVFSKNGIPYAKLVSVGPAEPVKRLERKPGRYAHLLKDVPSNIWFEPLSDDELDAWEGKYSGTP